MKLLGNGVDEIIDVGNDSELDELRDEVRQLKRDLSSARGEVTAAKRDAARAMGALRKVLAPLYRALQMVFGELDTIGVDEADSVSATPKTSAVWEAWKSKLPPACGRIIDALLLHGDLNGGQILVACQMGPNTMYPAIRKMKEVGILNKNGSLFSLKKL